MVFATALLAGVAAHASEAPPQPPVSELVAQAATDPATLARLWERVARDGAPIVEADGTGGARVTFLWRGAETRSVELGWPVLTADHRINALVRVGETDLWAKTVILPAGMRLSYQFAPDVPVPPGGPREAYRAAFRKALRPDPFNPQRWRPGDGAEEMSVLELPGADPQPWIRRRDAVARGTVEVHRLVSPTLGNEREIAIYRPASGRRAQWLLILFDGDSYRREVPTPVILDNMIAAGAIPPVTVIFVSSPGAEARSVELGCNPQFSTFLADELLPWARQRIAVPDKAERRILGGASYGALASACAAIDRPDAFGAVLSQSGSYWWKPTPGTPRFGSEEPANWVARRLADSPRLPIRFYLDAGVLETQAGGEGIRDTTRDLHVVLRDKGYQVSHAEFKGGHDWLAWRGTLSDGLLSLTSIGEMGTGKNIANGPCPFQRCD